jgi:hypothetical protein
LEVLGKKHKKKLIIEETKKNEGALRVKLGDTEWQKKKRRRYDDAIVSAVSQLDDAPVVIV